MTTNDKDVPTTEETAEMAELEELIHAKDDKPAPENFSGKDDALDPSR